MSLSLQTKLSFNNCILKFIEKETLFPSLSKTWISYLIFSPADETIVKQKIKKATEALQNMNTLKQDISLFDIITLHLINA